MVAVESTENELPAGTQILRRYSVVGKLAQGGMAEVYLARQVGPAGYNKLVVIKRVRPHLASDSDFVGMFVNEARLAAMINHPNVVQIFDLGDEPRPVSQGGGQDWFLAMEYLDGRDMLQVGRACRSHNKAVPFDVTARIIADACAGLDHAHNLKGEGGKSLDLVHRDMSPENILITFEGQVKVVDFGIAKASDNLIKTQAGQIKGKLGYVAPEAILGKPVDARADVFAVGATLYLFLSGRPAFSGTNPMEIFERSLKPPTPPREVNPRVPEALDAICMKALAQDREKRYRSAGEVRIALEGYLQSTGRPLGSVQLSQFMRILFPADKDPVRQRIDKMLAEAPVAIAATLPSTASAVARGLAPAPAPILVDDDKTNIVPPRDVSVPDPITLTRNAPTPAQLATASLPPRRSQPTQQLPTQSVAPQASAGPAHLRSMGVQKDVQSSPSGRPVDVEMTNEDLDLKTLAGRRDVAPTLQTKKPPTTTTQAPAIEVSELDEISAAVAEDDEMDIDVGPTLPSKAPHMPERVPTEARRFNATQMDAAAAAFDISVTSSGGDADMPPPPFEPSGRVQRPQSVVQRSNPERAPPAPPASFAPPPQSFGGPSPAPAAPQAMSAEPSFQPPAQTFGASAEANFAPQPSFAPVPTQAPVAAPPTWVPQPAPYDGALTIEAPQGPSLGIKLAMLAFGVLTGTIIVVVALVATGLLSRITG